MAYSFEQFKKEAKEVEGWFSKELSAVHTGRATPALLDGVTIESFGARTSISHIAGINTEDARTIRVAPWDKSHIKDIERAINDANLGVSVSSDDAGVRVFFPELTAERRELLAKVIKQKLEDARVSLRKNREEVWEDIQEKEKAGELSEDEKFRLKDELQTLVDTANGSLEGMADKKEVEIKG